MYMLYLLKVLYNSIYTTCVYATDHNNQTLHVTDSKETDKWWKNKGHTWLSDKVWAVWYARKYMYSAHVYVSFGEYM